MYFLPYNSHDLIIVLVQGICFASNLLKSILLIPLHFRNLITTRIAFIISTLLDEKTEVKRSQVTCSNHTTSEQQSWDWDSDGSVSNTIIFVRTLDTLSDPWASLAAKCEISEKQQTFWKLFYDQALSYSIWCNCLISLQGQEEF